MAVQSFPGVMGGMPPYATQLIVGGNFLTGNYVKTANIGAATYVLNNPGGQSMTFNFPNNNVDYTITSGQSQYFRLTTSESQIVIYSPGGAPTTGVKQHRSFNALLSDYASPMVYAVAHDGSAWTYMGGARGQIVRTQDFNTYENLYNLNNEGYASVPSSANAYYKQILNIAAVATHPVKAIALSFSYATGTGAYLYKTTDGANFSVDNLENELSYSSGGGQLSRNMYIHYINGYYIIKCNDRTDSHVQRYGGRLAVIGTDGNLFYTSKVDRNGTSIYNFTNNIKYFNGKWYMATDAGLHYATGPNLSTSMTWVSLDPFTTTNLYTRGVVDIEYTGTYYIALGNRKWGQWYNTLTGGQNSEQVTVLTGTPPNVAVSTDGVNFTQTLIQAPLNENRLNSYNGSPITTSYPNQLVWSSVANRWFYHTSSMYNSGDSPMIISPDLRYRIDPYYTSGLSFVSAPGFVSMAVNANATQTVGITPGGQVYYSTNFLTLTTSARVVWNGPASVPLSMEQVIHSENVYNTVGSGSGAWSTDGITWATATWSTAPFNMLSLAYGPNATYKYVAVGGSATANGTQIYYKTAPLSQWTLGPTFSSHVWYDVAYLNTRFVAVGNTPSNNTGSVAVSTDGLNWSTYPNSALRSVGKIAYLNGYYSVFPTYKSYSNNAYTGRHIWISTNLTTWATRFTNGIVISTAANEYFLHVAQSPTYIVAIKNDQKTYISTDGNTFNSANLLDFNNPGVYLESFNTGGVAYFAYNSNTFITTTDGVTWTTVASSSVGYFPQSLNYPTINRWGGNSYYGNQSEGSGFYVVTGADKPWFTTNTPATIYPKGSDGYHFTGVVISNDTNIAYFPFWTSRQDAANNPGNVYLSTDGGSTFNLTQSGVNLDSPVDGVANVNTFVAVGSGKIVVSTDGGVSWYTATSPTSMTQSWKGVAYGNGVYIGVGDSYNRISVDGITWTSVAHPGINVSGISYGNGAWIIPQYAYYSSAGYLYTSQNNSTSWTQRTPVWASGTAATFYDAAYGNGIYGAIDSSGRVFTATNVTSWAIATTLPSNILIGNYPNYTQYYGNQNAYGASNTEFLFKIKFMQGYFAMGPFGNQGSFYTSTDFSNWYARTLTWATSTDSVGLSFPSTKPNMYSHFTKFKNKIAITGRGNSVFIATSVGSAGVGALFKTNLADLS